ncbi:MAG: anthranilate phosphoribosyltransferase [Candidatus Omnitrophica bacterium]|nr:anthranilate phosphoribosyltransferase [Candidatus Omnitrophota bacterium]
MIKEAITLVAGKKDLSPDQMQAVMQEIFRGECATPDIVSFLTGLHSKGETVEELTTAVLTMLAYVDPIRVAKRNVLDTCGTGGDAKGTFNISTVAAFVAAGAGITVAKHGNRSISSRCGSADLLEALGVAIAVDKAVIQRCLNEIGIAFLFAPRLHPAMQHVMAARKQIGTKTMFNLLGPLINPARATHQLVGVFSEPWTSILARVLCNLGSEHVLVVHGKDGLDEVTTTNLTVISEYDGIDFKDYDIAPEDFGIARAQLSDLQANDIEDNKRIALEVLRGKTGAPRDIVLMNAGCAIYAANKAASIKEGIVLAAASIDSGRALEKLELLKRYSQEVAHG